MKIIYPKVCPTWLRTAIEAAIPLASDYLIDKYGDIFSNVHLAFQPNATRSRYFINKNYPHPYFKNEPVATISCRSELYLYVKNSLGTYKRGVNVGPTVQIACAIVHELTHHYQHAVNVPRSELTTTANELEFLKLNFPEWYKLIMISTKD